MLSRKFYFKLKFEETIIFFETFFNVSNSFSAVDNSERNRRTVRDVLFYSNPVGTRRWCGEFACQSWKIDTNDTGATTQTSPSSSQKSRELTMIQIIFFPIFRIAAKRTRNYVKVSGKQWSWIRKGTWGWLHRNRGTVTRKQIFGLSYLKILCFCVWELSSEKKLFRFL